MSFCTWLFFHHWFTLWAFWTKAAQPRRMTKHHKSQLQILVYWLLWDVLLCPLLLLWWEDARPLILLVHVHSDLLGCSLISDRLLSALDCLLSTTVCVWLGCLWETQCPNKKSSNVPYATANQSCFLVFNWKLQVKCVLEMQVVLLSLLISYFCWWNCLA